MTLHLCADFFAVIGPRLVADDMNCGDPGRNLRVEMRQERDEFSLPLAPVTLPVDLSCPGIERGKQIERPITFVFVFNLVRPTRDGLAGGVGAGIRLQGSFFVYAEAHFTVA
jgi:hypothetical protein